MFNKYVNIELIIVIYKIFKNHLVEFIEKYIIKIRTSIKYKNQLKQNFLEYL
jgi:hypothetical protein